MLRQIKSAFSRISLCIISGVLLILSFPSFNFEFLAWIGFIPLFFAIKGLSWKRALLFSYLAGIVYWSGIVYWLVHVTLAGTIVLVSYLALYFGIFAIVIKNYELLACRLSSRRSRGQASEFTAYEFPFITAASWVILEYVRSYLFSGFPWALLGYSQYLNLAAIQVSDITGAWGVSFLVMLVNAAIYAAFSQKISAVKKVRILVVPVLILLFSFVYGYFKIITADKKAYDAKLSVSVIQGNIPQELKWDPEQAKAIILKYITLSTQAALEKPDLIIWPEASLPVVLDEEPETAAWIKDLTTGINQNLLLGAVMQRSKSYYNSALLISPKGEITQRYDKVHLVPFGEYIPLKKYLSFMQTFAPIGDIEKGKEHTVFTVPAAGNKKPAKFSVLICFEDLFPELSIKSVKNGARMLVNITNDAWYNKTSAPYQHLQASVFRAVENRVYLARAANTGVSAFIGPQGKIISLVSDKAGKSIFVGGFKTQDIYLPLPELTFYCRHPGVFIFLLLVYLIYSICRLLRYSFKKFSVRK